MSETSEVNRPKVEKIMCNKCEISFTRRANLTKHRRKFHPGEVAYAGPGNIICGVCNEKFGVMAKLHEHLTDQHNVDLHFEKKTFYSDEEFQEWKRKIEEEMLCTFRIKNHHFNNRHGVKYSYFNCQRSGVANLKLNSKRPSRGSMKCGCTCPAIMYCSTRVIEEACEIKVLYQSVHFGHELEVRKLPLPKEDSASLALTSSDNVPTSMILDQAGQNPPSARISLISYKDLRNLCQVMGIRDVCTNLQLSSDAVTEVLSIENDLVTEQPEENIHSERDIIESVLHDSSNIQDKKKLLSKTLVCTDLQLSSDAVTEVLSSENDLVTEQPEENIHSESDTIESVLHDSSNIQDKKNLLLKTITQFRKRLHKFNSPEVLEHVQNEMNALNTYLDQFNGS